MRKLAAAFIASAVVYFAAPVTDEIAHHFGYDFELSTAHAALGTPTCATSVMDAGVASVEAPAAPAHSDGDLVIVVGMVNAAKTLTVSETGFTDYEHNSTNRGVFASVKIASSESGTYTVTTMEGGNSAFIVGTCVISGEDQTTPVDATPITADAANSDAPDPAAVTTVTANAFVFVVVGSVQTDLAATTQSSGYTELYDDSEATSQRILSLAYIDAGAAGSEDPGALSGFGTGADSSIVTIPIRPASGISFSAGPTLSSCDPDAGTCTFSATPSGSATFYGAAYPPAASAPANCDAVIAGSGALDTSSKAITGADTLVVDADLPDVDFYFCLDDASTQTATTEPTDTNPISRGAPTGYAVQALTSLDATSWFAQPVDAACDVDGSTAVLTGCADTSDFPVGGLVTVSAGMPGGASFAYVVTAKTATTLTLDTASTSMQTNVTVTGLVQTDGTAYFNGAIAANDIAEYQTAADIGGTVALDANWDGTYTPDAGEENDFATVLVNFEDVSNGSTGVYTNPTNPEPIYFNNVQPVCDISAIQNQAYYGAVSLDLDDYCSHAPGLTISYEVRSGDAMYTGLSLNGSTGAITGTISVEDENGDTVEIWANAGERYALISWTLYAVNTWTMVNCVGQTYNDCVALIVAAAPWRDAGEPLTVPGCSPSGTVASTDPASMDEVDPDGTIIVTMSSGVVCSGIIASTFDQSDTFSSTPTFNNGNAYDSSGNLLVSDCNPALVVYVRGIARKNNGAMCIITVAPPDPAYELAGFPVDQYGQVYASSCTPAYYVNGIPRGSEEGNPVCMSSVN